MPTVHEKYDDLAMYTIAVPGASWMLTGSLSPAHMASKTTAHANVELAGATRVETRSPHAMELNATNMSGMKNVPNVNCG